MPYSKIFHVPTTILGLTPISSAQMYHDLYHKIPYLHERVTQLAPLMDELDPYEPVRSFVMYSHIW